MWWLLASTDNVRVKNPRHWWVKMKHRFRNMMKRHGVEIMMPELPDIKVLWVGEGSSQNRPVWCCVLPHPHSHQQMCPSQSCILSHADMLHSAKLAVHTGVFPAARRRRESAGWMQIVGPCHDTFNFLKIPITLSHVILRIPQPEPFLSFCAAKLSPTPRRGGGGQR